MNQPLQGPLPQDMAGSYADVLRALVRIGGYPNADYYARREWLREAARRLEAAAPIHMGALL